MGLLGDIGKAFVDPIGTATGGSVLDYIPGIGDKRAQEEANKENQQANKLNRDWMERMSNTAYQRAMDDMKKSGLNPMLAYQQGGASVPTNTAPVSQAASGTKLADAALGAFTGISAAQTQRQQANTAQAQSESSISLQGAQTANTVATIEKTQAETAKTRDSIKSQEVRRQLEKAQIPLQKVKESAAEMAQKGLSTLENVSQKFLRNSAKPSVDPKTLQYKNPFKPESFKESLHKTDSLLFKGKK